jgi:hypothetical protein
MYPVRSLESVVSSIDAGERNVSNEVEYASLLFPIQLYSYARASVDWLLMMKK